jgi:hypothetical protein
VDLATFLSLAGFSLAAVFFDGFEAFLSFTGSADATSGIEVFFAISRNA